MIYLKIYSSIFLLFLIRVFVFCYALYFDRQYNVGRSPMAVDDQLHFGADLDRRVGVVRVGKLFTQSITCFDTITHFFAGGRCTCHLREVCHCQIGKMLSSATSLLFINLQFNCFLIMAFVLKTAQMYENIFDK